MRAFSSDENIIIENYKRCPNCKAENYWDNAEVWTIHRDSSFMNYSKCSVCGSTYRHLHSYFNRLQGVDVIHYHKDIIFLQIINNSQIIFLLSCIDR